MPTVLTPDQLQRDLAIRDLTDPEAGPHAIQVLVDVAVDALVAAWGCEVRRERGPRIVPLSDNYDGLRYPPADVTRDARYTRYVDEHQVLRSHASAMIPPALARLAESPVDDVLLVAPASSTAATPSTASTPPRRTNWTSGASPVGAWATLSSTRCWMSSSVPSSLDGIGVGSGESIPTR